MQPELDLGPITLQTFGLMMGLGFVVAGLAAARFLKELDKPVDWAYEMVFAALVGGIVGARLWWILENWSEAQDDVLGSLFSGAGLVWYGGALGGAGAVIFWAWRRNFLTLQLLDVAAVPLAAGYAIGRIGCQLAGDGDYGIPWNGPWAMAYPHGTVPTTQEVHPTPVYETITMLIRAAPRIKSAGVYPEDSSVDGGVLRIGGCDARELAREFGTPAYVVAEEDLRARARAFVAALADAHDGPGEVVFASKA